MAGYLRDIPVDPITKQKDWMTSSDDLLADPDQTTAGITDVHSASDGVSPFENTPYSCVVTALSVALACPGRRNISRLPDANIQC